VQGIGAIYTLGTQATCPKSLRFDFAARTDEGRKRILLPEFGLGFGLLIDCGLEIWEYSEEMIPVCGG